MENLEPKVAALVEDCPPWQTEEHGMLSIREKIMKCKLIALDSMDKHPLINPKYMNRLDKERLMKKIRELMDELSEEEITSRFNEICVEKLFCCGADISNYPVYVDPRTKVYNPIEDE